MITSRLSRLLSVAGALLIVSLMLAACDCNECTQQQDLAAMAPAPVNYYRMAPMMPPAPLVENIVIPETPRNLLWRPGYWEYNGSSFDWVSGELMARPSPTAIWSPDHWVEHTYGWTFEAGHWQ